MYFVRVMLVFSIGFVHAGIKNDDDDYYYEDNKGSSCTTPDREKATCVPLFSCPGLVTSVATLEPLAIKYFKLSMCLGCKAGSFMICCGQKNLADPDDKLAAPTVSTTIMTTTLFQPPTSPTTSQPPMRPPNESKRDKVLRTLMPDRRYCGLQHTDDRFYNSPIAALDEFPWLVHIKFTDIREDYKLGDRCTGVLLNPRYVLTDTICANPALKVRLGQYDVAHKVTCTQDPHAHECSEGTIEVRIDKKIDLLPDVSQVYALTLIRLANNVDYSDFVRPICLPLREANRASSDDPLIFSGWGGIHGWTEDAIKKRLVYDMKPIGVCESDHLFLKNFVPENTALSLSCFAPQEQNKDRACFGDHGGPLMYKDKRMQWYVEHVIVTVAYSPMGCGDDSTIVAIKITSEIIDKILENIEP